MVWDQRMAEIVPPPSTPPVTTTSPPISPWLTAQEAAGRAKVGSKTIYGAVRAGRLRAARIGGRRELRFLAAWVDAWLEETAQPVEVSRGTFRVAR